VPALLYSGDPELIKNLYKSTIGNGNAPKEPQPTVAYPASVSENMAKLDEILAESRALMQEDTRVRGESMEERLAIDSTPGSPIGASLVGVKGYSNGVVNLADPDTVNSMRTSELFDEKTASGITKALEKIPGASEDFLLYLATRRSETMKSGREIIANVYGNAVPLDKVYDKLMEPKGLPDMLNKLGPPKLVEADASSGTKLYAYAAIEHGQYFEVRDWQGGVSLYRGFVPNQQWILRGLEQINNGNARGDAINFIIESLSVVIGSMHNFQISKQVGEALAITSEATRRAASDQTREAIGERSELSELRTERLTLEHQLATMRLERIKVELDLASLQANHEQRSYEQRASRDNISFLNHIGDSVRSICEVLVSRQRQQQQQQQAPPTSQPPPAAAGGKPEEVEVSANIPTAEPKSSNAEIGKLQNKEESRIKTVKAEIVEEQKKKAALEAQLKGASERDARGESPIPEKNEPDQKAPGKVHMLAQFMMSNMFASGITAMGAAREAVATFMHVRDAWRASLGANVGSTYNSFVSAVESLSRFVSNLNATLHLTDIAHDLWITSGNLLEGIGNFIYSKGGISERFWAQVSGAQSELPDTAHADNDRVEPRTNLFGALHANVFSAGLFGLGAGLAAMTSLPATIPAALMALGALRFGPVAGRVTSWVLNTMDKTRSAVLVWATLGVGCLCFTAIVSLTVALLASGATSATAAHFTAAAAEATIWTVIKLFGRMIWTQLICMFMQKLICSPRATFMLVDTGFRIWRAMNVVGDLPSTGLARVIATLTSLGCRPGKYDPARFSVLEEANRRKWFRYAVTGSVMSMRTAMAFLLVQFGNGFARAVVETGAVRELASGGVENTASGGKAVFVEDSTFMGYVHASMLGTARPLVPRGSHSNSVLGLLPNLFDRTGDYVGTLAGHAWVTKIVKGSAGFLPNFSLFGTENGLWPIAGPEGRDVSRTAHITSVSSSPSPLPMSVEEERKLEGRRSFESFVETAALPLGAGAASTIRHACTKISPLLGYAFSHSGVLISPFTAWKLGKINLTKATVSSLGLYGLITAAYMPAYMAKPDAAANIAGQTIDVAGKLYSVTAEKGAKALVQWSTVQIAKTGIEMSGWAAAAREFIGMPIYRLACGGRTPSTLIANDALLRTKPKDSERQEQENARLRKRH
jgi:hypothetical protein